MWIFEERDKCRNIPGLLQMQTDRNWLVQMTAAQKQVKGIHHPFVVMQSIWEAVQEDFHTGYVVCMVLSIIPLYRVIHLEEQHVGKYP